MPEVDKSARCKPTAAVSSRYSHDLYSKHVEINNEIYSPCPSRSLYNSQHSSILQSKTKHLFLKSYQQHIFQNVLWSPQQQQNQLLGCSSAGPKSTGRNLLCQYWRTIGTSPSLRAYRTSIHQTRQEQRCFYDSSRRETQSIKHTQCSSICQRRPSC